MTLQNLVGISLDRIAPAKETIRRLLDGAGRHIADAKVQAISAETRFGSAYTAIRMLADVGLHAHGYRTLTSKPGHHQTAIQTCLRLSVSTREPWCGWIRCASSEISPSTLETIIPDSAVLDCLTNAQSLYALTLDWLEKNKRELL